MALQEQNELLYATGAAATARSHWTIGAFRFMGSLTSFEPHPNEFFYVSVIVTHPRIVQYADIWHSRGRFIFATAF